MPFEFQILDLIQNIHTPILDTFMCVVSRLGSVGFIWFVLSIVLLVIPKTRKSGAILMAALVIDYLLCNGVIKRLADRARPCDINTTIQLLVSRPGGSSFPSSHTASSFTAVAALYFSGEKKLWKPALVLACLIAFSRLYLYVHFPTDVLGGMLLGILVGFAVCRAADILDKRRDTSTVTK